MSKIAVGHGNLQSHLMPGVFYVVTAYKLCWHPFFSFPKLDVRKRQSTKKQRLVQRQKTSFVDLKHSQVLVQSLFSCALYSSTFLAFTVSF